MAKTTEACTCPVCGKYMFTTWDDVCDVCGWFHDPVQEENEDEEECANLMSLNQARAAYKAGRPVE